jgi:hypothetical protein
MKRNYRKPNLDALWMLHVLALQVIYQLLFMFLKMNQSFFVEEMKENRNKLPAATVKDHRCKIAFLPSHIHYICAQQ